MNNQKVITLKLTQEETELLLCALWSKEQPGQGLLLQKIYAARLGMPLERYQAAFARAQKKPPADACNIHQGQASRRSSP